MGIFDEQIADLKAGRDVRFRPRGHSMSGRIEDRDLVHVAPFHRDPQKGDVVLCKVMGRQYIHLVSGVRGGQYQISNNRGKVNGWTGRDSLFGLLISVNMPYP